MKKYYLEEWKLKSTPQVIDDIKSIFHNELIKSIPEIMHLFDIVCEKHGAGNQNLVLAHQHFYEFSKRIPFHLLQEEQIMFPLIVQVENGAPAVNASALRYMLHDHDQDLAMISQIRLLTNNFTPPAKACPAWRKLYSNLEKMMFDLDLHIAVENDVLFARVLDQVGGKIESKT